jgi:hypothetical protein
MGGPFFAKMTSRSLSSLNIPRDFNAFPVLGISLVTELTGEMCVVLQESAQFSTSLPQVAHELTFWKITTNNNTADTNNTVNIIHTMDGNIAQD